MSSQQPAEVFSAVMGNQGRQDAVHRHNSTSHGKPQQLFVTCIKESASILGTGKLFFCAMPLRRVMAS